MALVNLQLRTLSSMAKVFPNRICGKVLRKSRVVRGQELSFQIAYRLTSNGYRQSNYQVTVNSDLTSSVSLFLVENVPSQMPVYPMAPDDGNYLTRSPGLFPDPLVPMTRNTVRASVQIWKSLWVSVRVPEDCPAGEYPIQIVFTDDTGAVAAKTTYRITVEPYALPQAELIFTQWFHCDCIADAHKVPVLSEAHWTLIEKYMRMAADHGMNMILTPVVTPPLDTDIGAERPTVQLVAVEKAADGGYRFDCRDLVRFVKLALDAGIRYFEISHFFTQWGAAKTPKVVATVNGKKRKIFGWETDADDPAYVAFLNQLVSTVIDCFAEMGVTKDRLWFHVSDEPHMSHLEQYRKVSSILHSLIEGCHHIDALSNYEFYGERLVERPVVSTAHITPFLEAGVQNLWCYYCCVHGYQLSNRFFAMPSVRNRIIGLQLYKHRIEGFLQWGYNFYYSERSRKKIDPYVTSDGDFAWPSGDPYSVYPHGDEVIPSLRLKVFGNALEDIRLLRLLEQKIGYEAVVELIESVAGEPITFTYCPADEGFYTRLYDRIFEKLAE